MKSNICIFVLSVFILSCNSNADITEKEKEHCTDDCMVKGKTAALSCKLTTPELQKRRETVIESLRKQMIEKKELPNGYAFKFPGTDNMVDELTEFIKTERECCDFFTFNLSVSGDKSSAWLELTGNDGVKDFIQSELGM